MMKIDVHLLIRKWNLKIHKISKINSLNFEHSKIV